MIFSDKQITLKDGRTAILRSPRGEDGEQLLDYFRQASGETEFIIRYPEEWEGVTADKEAEWAESALTSPDSLIICCEIGGRIIGNCEIRFSTALKTNHRARVAISILKEFWNLGIGSAFFTELIAVAEARESTRMIELEFIEGNGRARHLYEKFGFRIVSYKPNAIKLKDGSFKHEYYMQKYL